MSDVDRLGGQDRPCVEALVDLDDRDTAHGVAFDQGTGDRGRAPPTREEGEVDIQETRPRQFEDLRGEDPAVRHDDAEIERPVFCDDRGDLGLRFRLSKQQPTFLGREFHGRGHRFAGPSAGPVRLGDDQSHLITVHKILERRGRARVDVPIRVGSVDESTATALVGRYVALRRTT